MANLIYQSKINHQLQGKLIRHFYGTPGLQNVTWRGGTYTPYYTS